jgi:two-component system cell cycle sensor histidine kinase/response regulator CckA
VLALEKILAQGGNPFQALPFLDLDQDRTSPRPSSVTVLVVDDNDQSRRLTARMLRDEGYHVIEAHSGERALECLKTGDVKVVLTDIAMPGMDGIELAHRIMAADASRPVVLMSGYDRIYPQLGALAANFPLLQKPFSADQLGREIREALHREAN